MKEIKRGYVKWEDENGFHKEPLADHPELLASASVREQLHAEEARRLNAAAEDYLDAADEDAEDLQQDTLEALKEAPEDVLTAGQLVAADDGHGETIIVPASEVEAPITSENLRGEAPAEVTSGKIETTTITGGKINSDQLHPDALWSEDHQEALAQLKRETT